MAQQDAAITKPSAPLGEPGHFGEGSPRSTHNRATVAIGGLTLERSRRIAGGRGTQHLGLAATRKAPERCERAILSCSPRRPRQSIRCSRSGAMPRRTLHARQQSRGYQRCSSVAWITSSSSETPRRSSPRWAVVIVGRRDPLRSLSSESICRSSADPFANRAFAATAPRPSGQKPASGWAVTARCRASLKQPCAGPARAGAVAAGRRHLRSTCCTPP